MTSLIKVINRYPEVANKAADVVAKQVETVVLSSNIADNEKAIEFAIEVSSFVKSEEFKSELSSAVGEPFNTESEDEFVGRAKEAMRALLKKKFI